MCTHGLVVRLPLVGNSSSLHVLIGRVMDTRGGRAAIALHASARIRVTGARWPGGLGSASAMCWPEVHSCSSGCVGPLQQVSGRVMPS